MVLVTPRKIIDLLIERLQEESPLDFDPFEVEQGDICRFRWELRVREGELLDINDIEFHIPEHYRSGE